MLEGPPPPTRSVSPARDQYHGGRHVETAAFRQFQVTLKGAGTAIPPIGKDGKLQAKVFRGELPSTSELVWHRPRS